MTSRRNILAASLALPLTAVAVGAAARAPSDAARRILLWPDGAPGAGRVTVTEQEIPRSADAPPGDTAWIHVRSPALLYTPAAVPNGAALLLVPGGGYMRVAIGLGGMALADHFARLGFAVYTLVYRLPADGWEAGPDAPLQDAQRALRLIRSRAVADGFDPDRIGVIGGSAGGHLAARLAVRQDLVAYTPRDAIDSLPLAPRLACLLFPVIETTGPDAHRGSRDQLFGKGASDARAAPFAANARIAENTPPVLLAHALDDRVVRWRNSLTMLEALEAAGVPREMHLFERGGHGFGLDGPAARWTSLFADFAQRHALIRDGSR